MWTAPALRAKIGIMTWFETDSMALAVALMIGLLLGIERGWTYRERREGGRVAGLRTFGVIGLLGGVCGLLAEQLGAALFGLVAVALGGVLVVAHLSESADSRDRSVTSVAAALLAFALGGLSAVGESGLAAAAAVVTALILSYKALLHGWIDRLDRAELRAVLKLLLISVVVLPLLPDRGYGPLGRPESAGYLVDGGVDREHFLCGLFCRSHWRNAAGHRIYRTVWRARLLHRSNAAVFPRRAKCAGVLAAAGDRDPTCLRHHVSAHVAGGLHAESGAPRAARAARAGDGRDGLPAHSVVLA